MSENEDILCEAPGPNGTSCTLPYGHKGNMHAFEIQLPPHVAQLIEHHIEQLETAKARHEKAARMATIFKWVAIGVIVVYIGMAIGKLFGL